MEGTVPHGHGPQYWSARRNQHCSTSQKNLPCPSLRICGPYLCSFMLVSAPIPFHAVCLQTYLHLLSSQSSCNSHLILDCPYFLILNTVSVFHFSILILPPSLSWFWLASGQHDGSHQVKTSPVGPSVMALGLFPSGRQAMYPVKVLWTGSTTNMIAMIIGQTYLSK